MSANWNSQLVVNIHQKIIHSLQQFVLCLLGRARTQPIAVNELPLTTSDGGNIPNLFWFLYAYFHHVHQAMLYVYSLYLYHIENICVACRTFTSVDVLLNQLKRGENANNYNSMRPLATKRLLDSIWFVSSSFDLFVCI